MKFQESPLAGAYTIEMDRLEDERGFFARSYSAEEFAARGLPAAMPQSSVSFNARRGTLRGLHYQAEPHAEDKLVRCTAGAIYDVIVDLRPDSPTREALVRRRAQRREPSLAVRAQGSGARLHDAA